MLKDEERRKRLAREKAEKAEAAAPQVFEEETRMSAPDSSSRGHTPAPHRILTGDALLDESQNSISTPGDTNKGNKKGRMEISITDMDCLVKEVRVDELAEYQWQGSELFMIQEQVSLYLGVKSFKRKYPGLKRRPVEAEERTFLEDSGLVPKSMCDLGLTAVGSAEILDIMFQDFPEKYEEFRKHVRDKQAREASFKQRAAIGLQRKDGTKVEPREQALEAVAAWNANLNRERREERRCALDLQTFTVHYPKLDRETMKRPVPKIGLYPVAVIPGQFCDHYKKYTPNELMYFPVNTVLYGPLRPNERQRDGSDDGSGSESSSSSSSSSSSGESSSESESEGEDPARCKMCNGTKKKNKDSIPEVLLTCVQCKSCYHPTCKEFTPEMIVHLTKYEWQCTACKKCTKCRDPNLKDRIMSCQLCDRGYHLSCIGLKKMPEGRWHCTVCAYCSSCGSRNPGGSDWQHEFKKGEKGIKIYQRTLCTPCFKLWRKGKYCQLCSKCHSMKPEEDPNLIQCNSCDRWLHKECYGSKYGLTNKLMSTSSIQCDFCVERITMSTQGLNRSLIKV
uniref:PHD finger protein 10 n=1 Tax=Lygus hesperus TaxID=30085 RepID=A0A0A9Z0R0_LYGHE